MAALADYAAMARRAYKLPDRAEASVDGWEVERLGETRSGFLGCVYRAGSEAVVVFTGTNDFQDVLADVKLAVGICPSQATPAHNLLLEARSELEGSLVTLVGHSLGGGLAQIVSHWHKVRFVTFNAPPMLGTIQKTKINPLMPHKAWRAIKGSFGQRAPGFNYRLRGDVVSSRFTSTLGHYGSVTTWEFPGVGRDTPLRAHAMETVEAYLQGRPELADSDPFQ